MNKTFLAFRQQPIPVPGWCTNGPPVAYQHSIVNVELHSKTNRFNFMNKNFIKLYNFHNRHDVKNIYIYKKGSSAQLKPLLLREIKIIPPPLY